METTEYRTLLINTPTPAFMPNKEFVMPQGILYLAGYLQGAGESVEILDLNTYKPWLYSHNGTDDYCNKLISDKIDTYKPNLIGIGCLFSGQFTDVLKYTHYIRSNYPALPIVIGGMHATLFAKSILENTSSIDYIVIGEGETQLLSLVKFLKGEINSLHQISDGFAFRENNEIIIYPKNSYIANLDSVPFPAYNLIDIENYKHDTSHWHNPKKISIDVTIPFISSRSCPYRCNFCSMYLVGGKKFRKRSAENVVQEIELLYNEYGIHHFNFMDDNLTLHKKRILQICDSICKKNINIQFEALNGLMVNTLDEEVIDALVAAGWVRGALAIESGSDYIRNTIMKKKLPENKIYDVVHSVRRYEHIWLKAYYIMGMPEDTDGTLTDTYNMIKELDIDDTYVTNIVPYPGTELYEQCKNEDLFLINTENLWNNDSFYMTNKDKFYIKTQTLDQQDLMNWRNKFDELIMEKKNKYVQSREN